jgi:lipoyl(octanoyl) transferase
VTEETGQLDKILNVMKLGRCPYQTAWSVQIDLHSRRVHQEIPDTLVLVEHNSVYTLGKHADPTHLVATDEYLKAKGIEVIQVDRGGDITYHGPGQLVGYPIFNLKAHRENVGWFVSAVEEVLINTLADFNIPAERQSGYTGVWVNDQKIAAIGTRVSKWVTMHGFALNIFTDLTLFRGIIPCGLSTKGVGRMVDLNPTVTAEDVAAVIVREFVKVFGFKGWKFVPEETFGDI